MKILGLFLAACALMLAGCENPPQTEIDGAIKAFESASRSPDVFTYAPDSLRAAQEKLQALRAEVDLQARKGALGRRYAAARSLAADTLAAAQKAVTDAARAKEQTRNDAAGLIETVTGSIPSVETKLWGARRVKGIRLDQEILSAADNARAALADAQKDFTAGAFAAARAKAQTIQEALADTESRISEAVRLSKKR
jgi:hypothetical protein